MIGIYEYPIGRERCAIAAQGHIETLNDLFAALFKPGEDAGPIIRQPQRPLREELFALFFPDALVSQYADKSKSNLTWFFNNDPRNKSVRRSLVALLREDPRAVTDETHRKCHAALWPRAGHAVFDARALREALGAIRLNGAVNTRLHITQPEGEGRPSRLDVFYDVDEAGALARMLLTLAVGADIPADAMGEVWRDETGGDCDFLRGDDTVAGRIRYCRMLDLQGRHARAFEGFEALAKQLGRPAQTADESAMYCRLGEMLFTGEGCARDEKAALEYDRLGCLDENPKSWYQLGRHATGTPAREAMERAADLGCAPAIRELGMAWYNGSARLACLRSLESARRCFQKGLTLPGADGAHCAYMLGQIYEGQNARDAAVNAYRVAQEGGSAEAAERLARLDWMTETGRADGATIPGGADDALKYCLMNAPTGCNRLFLEQLKGRWETVVCGAGGAPLPVRAQSSAQSLPLALRELAQGVYWGGAPRFPELVIALLSDDWQDNLCQAVALLGELQRLAQSLGDRAWDLVDQASIYVMAEHDNAALLLDAALAGMGELYFRVRVCDPALDAADQLFASAPLFLPRLRAAEDARVRLKLIGCGDVAMAALRRAVALPLPEGALSVDVYGGDAGAMGGRFYQRCPGLAAEPGLCGAPVRFHDCDPEAGLIAQLDEPGEDGLAQGNYFVVAAGDDALNLRLAVLLRIELMRRRLESDEQPFIAVCQRHPVAGWLAGSLPSGLDAQGAAPRWCAQYELFAFGALSMYAPSALRDEALERRARRAHMLFIGLPNTRDARHAAMASYYRRQFNRDTARAAAQSLIYRMHLAGIGLPGWRLYGVPDEEALLGPAYTRWLRDAEHLQQATRDEHSRRNRMLLALGWSPATPEDVTAYVRRGNPSHLLHTARLNPFICPWEALESGELLQEVRDAVRSRFPEKSVPDPRRDEEESVRDTERLLTE